MAGGLPPAITPRPVLRTIRSSESSLSFFSRRDRTTPSAMATIGMMAAPTIAACVRDRKLIASVRNGTTAAKTTSVHSCEVFVMPLSRMTHTRVAARSSAVPQRPMARVPPPMPVTSIPNGHTRIGSTNPSRYAMSGITVENAMIRKTRSDEETANVSTVVCIGHLVGGVGERSRIVGVTSDTSVHDHLDTLRGQSGCRMPTPELSGRAPRACSPRA
ncbi:hypothetical protein A8L33_13360 [Microbacterium aurantiacum]|nr:hypothetical protein A8L33_13360 [Microbacterium chocolatum]